MSESPPPPQNPYYATPLPPQPPQQWGYQAPGPRPVTYPAPVRVEPVPGENFGLAILPAPGLMSGPAVSSLVAGIAAVLVSLVVWCFGLAGASAGWGGLVSGAFVVLATLLGLAAVIVGLISLRETSPRASANNGPVKGRGLGITGMVCGGVAILVALLGLVVAIAMSGQLL